MPILRFCDGTKTPLRDETSSLSPRRISPSSGCSRPAMRRKVVDLPHPEGPSREKISPRLISSEMPSTARKAPNSLLTPFRPKIYPPSPKPFLPELPAFLRWPERLTWPFLLFTIHSEIQNGCQGAGNRRPSRARLAARRRDRERRRSKNAHQGRKRTSDAYRTGHAGRRAHA